MKCIEILLSCFERFQLTICTLVDCSLKCTVQSAARSCRIQTLFLQVGNHMRPQLKCCELRLKCLLMEGGRNWRSKGLYFELCSSCFEISTDRLRRTKPKARRTKAQIGKKTEGPSVNIKLTST